VVDHLVPAGGGAGSGGDEGLGGAEEGLGALFVEAEKAGEAEVGEGVPSVRAAFDCGECGVACEEGADGGLVGEDGGGVDVCGGDFGVALEDELRVLEGSGGVAVVSWDAGGFDEGGDGVGEFGYRTNSG
jgi:hypothetical protein